MPATTAASPGPWPLRLRERNARCHAEHGWMLSHGEHQCCCLWAVPWPHLPPAQPRYSGPARRPRPPLASCIARITSRPPPVPSQRADATTSAPSLYLRAPAPHPGVTLDRQIRAGNAHVPQHSCDRARGPECRAHLARLGRERQERREPSERREDPRSSGCLPYRHDRRPEGQDRASEERGPREEERCRSHGVLFDQPMRAAFPAWQR